MDAIRTASVSSMRLSRQHGSTTSPSSPLAQPTPGSLHLTTHHLIFEREGATVKSMEGDAGPSNGEVRDKTAGVGEEEDEIWIPLPLLHSVTRTPPTLTGTPTPLVLRTRDYTTYSLYFSSATEADQVWDSLKGLCGSFSAGGLEGRYAFFCGPARGKEKGKGKAGWEIYSPEEEFARMGLGTRSKAWRFTSINADFQFCPSYPSQIVVPAKISDTTLSYAVKYRSKSRIPGLVYLHWANLGSITRSSQPMVGVTQHARSIQDEKLIEAIFASHSQHSHSLTPMSVSDRPSSPSSPLDTSSCGGVVYGAAARNIIVDARPTKNAYANSVKGAGTENMAYYKNCEKEYLGIDNIHVMRSSLTGVFDALADAEASGRLDRAALRRTGWLSHLTNILDGVLIIVRTVHLNNSHALVHCSDGWDRTSQLSALPQICLDPFFRTGRGLAVLIEKDWISYGHRFADRSGHLCNDRVGFVQKLGDDASTQQAFLATVTRQFAPSSHAFKETCPVFQQFLDCVWQLQRQFPYRFEYNEKLLRHLVRETYGGASGSFLFNSEQQRAELRARERTSSVWETVFDLGEDGALSLKPEYRNAAYNPKLDDAESKAPDADLGVLLFNPQDVRWWFELFGRSDEEMNGSPLSGDNGALPQEPTVTEHKVVREGQSEDDPVLHPLAAQTASLALSSPAASPAHLSAPHPSSSRSPSPSSTRDALPNQQQLSETVASVQKLGWSAWKSVRKFGEDAARQYKEAQAAREAQEAEAAARVGGHSEEGSSGTWRAVGRSEDGANELADGAGWGAPASSMSTATASRDGAFSAAAASSFGRSAGSMWSKISASNPWAATGGAEGGLTFSTTAPSSSASSSPAPAYKPYQSRTRASADGLNDPTLPSSPHSRPSASSRPVSIPALRQPSTASAFSLNPWETISREEAVPTPAVPSAPSHAQTAPLFSPPVMVDKPSPPENGGDPLGVGLA
ncbi:hypothetical protein JCM10213_001146 [Rhodosporidiobolus nylandii]